jgi:hypothetical protein
MRTVISSPLAVTREDTVLEGGVVTVEEHLLARVSGDRHVEIFTAEFADAGGERVVETLGAADTVADFLF